MIELCITMTRKSYAPGSEWILFTKKRRTFTDMQGAMAWINDHYSKSRRTPMYRDLPEGKTIKCGYVIGFRNEDSSIRPVQKWIQQDWLSFKECKPLEIA